ncbi:hypothetical protein SLEP1_g50979 [Rubroshorea leprosula]|uniref:Cupin type-1 domain-containing protein n=1 Tax=Rubroshorea leprosula TaxID=152421 RepID=A0AAV5M2J9_9ROSI|nr:hypothetical protein SLEP1_g50979 [Rubroshorea leprosula]
MAMYKPHVLLLLLTLFLSSAFLSLGFHLRSPGEEAFELLTESNPESPRREYEHCQQRCQEEQGHMRQGECQQQCERRMREREYQEEDDPRHQYEHCQQRCHRQHHDRGSSGTAYKCREYEERQEGRRDNPQEPCKQYEQCRERCQTQHQSQKKQQQCQRTCREQLEEQQEDCKSEQEEQSNNPFFIRSQWFQPRFSTGQGHWSVLPKFNQMSPLLRGIENYRLSILDAYANTFVVPHHGDSDSLFVVVRGQGTITFVSDDGRQSFNVKYGDAIRVPAGTTVYMVNSERDDEFISPPSMSLSMLLAIFRSSYLAEVKSLRVI